MYNFTVFRLDQCKKYIFVPNYAQDSHVNGSFHRRTSRDGFDGDIEGGGAPRDGNKEFLLGGLAPGFWG